MNDIKKLGFGLMRLPKSGGQIELKETSRMVDHFLENGFTYFDTAYIYEGSEEATRKALIERHPRENYTLATKLFGPEAKTRKDGEEQFYTSLRRTGAEYFDYYLMHSLMNNNYKKYETLHLWDFANEMKEKGLIRHVGFSFHSGPKLLERILRDHPEAEFVQLQINYADWENASVQARANYEVARKYGKPIIVMEPVKGGSLADPQQEIRKMFEAYAPDRSPASWAIRFAASLDGILAVLSGMSNMQQMLDNTSFMKEFESLCEEEQAIIREAQKIMGASAVIPCTACRYCTKGCPMQIPIPEIFAAMNKRLGNGLIEASREDYRAVTANGSGAGDCISCGQCEAACPQHIKIMTRLEECEEALA